ncbi:MAG: helix-turn-helix domain-containing protein [Chitinophagaceae bacterium]|nr:helix-turn-helix domain-containing protein [Chitinophagaceae bacterium]
MRVIEFTIPVAKENSVVVQEDKMPHFYNHLHRHNETQITWVIKGEGTLIAGNYMQRFKEGDIYVLGANQPHIFKSDPGYFEKQSKKEVHGLTIFFNPGGFFNTILNLPETKSIKKFVTETSYGLQLPSSGQERIAKEMLRVKNSKQGFRLASFINLLQDMASIKGWKTLATISAANSFTDQEGLRMNDVYQYTMAHYPENITLKQVADIAFLTPQAFCRYFKKHTRKTYIAFLSEIRISEACKKIIAGDFDSISSVAYDTGFSSAVSFNRVFKKITGKSPKQYLREYNQKVD